MALKAIALNCTLKRGAGASSTEKLLAEIRDAFRSHDVDTEIVRVVDLNILPGVTSDEGPGDAWPTLRQKIVEADILIIGSPIWLGQPSSVAKRVLERLDAFLGETDDHGHMPSYGKVAAVAVVGNEDGAHHVAAELFQALNDVGFTTAASAMTYWVGEAMGRIDYKDLPRPPEKTTETTATLAATTAHLARLLKASPYPALK
jgi:multimeric flavodoxin WrbA